VFEGFEGFERFDGSAGSAVKICGEKVHAWGVAMYAMKTGFSFPGHPEDRIAVKHQ
jgi:hypothetical protein